MNINNNWSNESHNSDKDLNALLNIKSIKNLSSKNPLENIKNNLILNIIFGIAICLLYIYVLFYFPIWQVQLTIGITLIFSIWAIYTAFIEFKKIRTDISPDNSLLAELKKHHSSLTNWMKTQQLVGIFIYPISAIGGFMLGGTVGSGKNVESFMGKPSILLILLVVLIVLVPLCHFFAKWMFNYSFGKHLKSIDQKIKDLENGN
jgi:membrane protein YdbS with pleckstrin-like domain